ncbi:hypothetical protein GCK72_016717 [Caenorhabditis remanei]|uniref:Uncharacterized protein n=1 Tax=Caenorhabditis remanei TaxID=31234 RepID=A0A6A5G5D3_CAERE|nr:hypothetical protein GCK72_016717 [Caenorhabditis remanei]KAF1750170.1 hypothetical protein GCK72_016717 [Caenorhabditis remanei]
MNRSFVFLLTLLTICVAQEDSGLYVSRIKIETFTNKAGNDKTFTYYVKDSYDQVQVDNFKTVAESIGYLYEDDYAADTVSCTTDVCPKMRRIYEHTTNVNGKVTTRLIDSTLKTSTAATTAKPIGFVAPYPGYCSSNDLVPIIEMYSDALQQYAYWSLAQPNQLVNIASTTVDTSRYNPKRLVGYALSGETDRLVLSNAAPDFVKPIGKANYTHSFYPAYQLVEFTSGNNKYTLGAPPSIDAYAAKPGFIPKNTGIFVIGKGTSAELSRLSAVCGELIPLYVASDSAKSYGVLVARSVVAPLQAIAQAGWTFKKEVSACGGIKGLYPLMEFKHRYIANRYTYTNSIGGIDENWELTTKDLGYVPLDQFGFVLINAVV